MCPIYLDNAATTPLHPDIRAAMEPFLNDLYGNPSSVHGWGRRTRQAVEQAREKVADAIGADPAEIVFTSGGTEADNLAIIGAALANRDRGRHIVTSAIEHHAVLHTCQFLETLGFEVTYAKPNSDGIVTLDAVMEAVRPDTILVTIMYVNNETGAIQPISEIAAYCQEKEIICHTDAVQAVGLLPFDVKQLGVHLLSLSGHKLQGPKGIGALFIKNKTRWTPILHGGTQEREKRAGTENVPGIVGLGTAIVRLKGKMAESLQHIRQLRDRMLSVFDQEGIDWKLNSPHDALPSIVSVAFPGVKAESLLMNLDLAGIASSSGSACTSGSLQPSHVLMAMGLDENRVKSSVRFSFSEQNTLDEVEQAAQKTAEIVRRLARK